MERVGIKGCFGENEVQLLKVKVLHMKLSWLTCYYTTTKRTPTEFLCMCITKVCVCVLEMWVLLWFDRPRFGGLVEKSSICISNVTLSSRHLFEARGGCTQIKGLSLRERQHHPDQRLVLLWSLRVLLQRCISTPLPSRHTRSASTHHFITTSRPGKSCD